MKNKYFILLPGFLIALVLACDRNQVQQSLNIIPNPAEISLGKGTFKFNRNTRLIYHEESLDFAAEYLQQLCGPVIGYQPAIERMRGSESNNSIVLTICEKPDPELGNEGYLLEVKPKKMRLSANSTAGILYGIQTIYQLLDSEQPGVLPACTIRDYPRFAWRGLHLDVSRHFMPAEFIYRMLDYMAMHKLNVFHWHLVDDQGWRIEIKQYPKLTKVGAWRVDMSHLHWNDRPLLNDPENATYGGYYSQEEIKALVAFAAKRNIVIVPEIEMPAHVMSALAAYPEFSCTGKNLGVPPGGVWPITHIYCAGNDDTFTFLENILTEVIEIFPSEYIHIGGDEADKANWQRCPRCQKRIRQEKLADEDALQSYFIGRIERFLNAHGRRLIGWDEILEGGLAPNATVMSWRGERGGIEAAKMGHYVVMSPTSHCYFDYYQGDPASEPLAIGGYTTLKKVYSYEPIPPELTTEQAGFILGAQANVWTEYMPITRQVEYMVFPRLAAMAEVIWSPAEKRNWADFCNRMDLQYKRYDRLGINYSLSAFQVNVNPEVNTVNRSLMLGLFTEMPDTEIRYTLDGSNPLSGSVYVNTVEITESKTLKAVVVRKGQRSGKILERNFDLHRAFAGKVELAYPNSPKYSGTGVYSLVDGVRGSRYFGDGLWTGFLGDDMVATIRFSEPLSVSFIGVDALQDFSRWIFFPEKVIYEVSEDGLTFIRLDEIINDIPEHEKGRILRLFETRKTAENITAIRVSVKNRGTCPSGHPGAGQRSWLFVSEVIVR